MHVPVRYTYEAGGDPAACHLYDVGIGACGPGCRLNLVRDLARPRQFDQPAVYFGIDVRSPRNNRSFTQGDITQLLLVSVRMVRSEGHIYGDPDVRINPVSARLGPSQAQLLLDC